jgi:hypothetical protein
MCPTAIVAFGVDPPLCLFRSLTVGVIIIPNELPFALSNFKVFK